VNEKPINWAMNFCCYSVQAFRPKADAVRREL